MKQKNLAFTLIEIMVVISIISVLAGVVYAGFGDARALSRDEVRKSTLQEMQVALELYKAQFGFYPAEGDCGGPTISPGDTPATSGINWEGQGTWTGPGPQGAFGSQCAEYIVGLAPNFISVLPLDPVWEEETARGYAYQVNSTGSAYKLLSYQTAEADVVADYNHPFSRCPSSAGANCGATPDPETYAVYSFGAQEW